MIWRRSLLAAAFLAVLVPSGARAQFPVVSADDVRALQEGGKKHVLIDTRTADEYREGHIPGAINIPPDRMKASRQRLPKDTAALLIFYCRGVG